MMAVISSDYNFPVPETDCLSYIFDAGPYKDTQAWPSNEPILLSTNEADSSYTFDEIKDLVKRVGCGLHHVGARGKRVILCGETNTHTSIALLGVLAAGAACGVVPPASSISKLARYARQMTAEYILCDLPSTPRVCEVACQVGIPLNHVFAVDEFTSEVNPITCPVRHWSWLMNAPGWNDYVWPRLGKESKDVEAILVTTSGTTGEPKLAARTHYNFIANIESILYKRSLEWKDEKHKIFGAFKIYGVGFITHSLLVPLKARSKTIVAPKIDMQTMRHGLHKFRPNLIMIPKHLICELLAYHDEDKPDLSCVKCVISGAMVIPLNIRKDWTKKYGSSLNPLLGMTELGFITGEELGLPLTKDTVGKLLPNFQAMIVDSESRPLERGQQGELWYSHSGLMKYYCNEPEHTARAVTKDGWFKSGDICWIDNEGYVYFVGRCKDVFKLSGICISSSMIESDVMDHPELKSACVVPVLRSGEEEPLPYMFLVKKPGSNLTVEEFTHWVEHSMVSNNMPFYGGFSFLDNIPLSSSGNMKTDAKVLKQLAQAKIHDPTVDINNMPYEEKLDASGQQGQVLN